MNPPLDRGELSVLRRIMWECGARSTLRYISAKMPRRGRKPKPANTIPPSVKSDILDRLIAEHGATAVTAAVRFFQKAGRPRKIRLLNVLADAVDWMASEHDARGSPAPLEDALAEARQRELDEGRAIDSKTMREYYSRSCTELAARDAAILADVRSLVDVTEAEALRWVAREWAVTPFIVRLRAERALRRQKRRPRK